MTLPRLGLPDYGVGVGLRVPHYRTIFSEHPAVDFFEVISENFMVDGGRPLHNLDRVLESYRVVQHGVSLNIGGPEAPDPDYLRRLKKLVRRVNPAWLSDHFCWTGVPGNQLHDLLPLPFTPEMARVVAERARQVQDVLEVPFALENTSSYLTYRRSEMTEWEFIGEVLEQANIGLLFDVNNVYVSAYNHGFDAYEFVRNVPHDRIVQIHLAGHTDRGTHLIDTHNGAVIDPVWELYRATIELAGPVSTLIEWDDEIPAFDELLALAERARGVRQEGLDARSARGPSYAIGKTMNPRPSPPDSNAPERAALGWVQGGPREHAAQEG